MAMMVRGPIGKQSTIRLPRGDVSEEELYRLSMRMLKWFIVSPRPTITLNHRLRAAMVGVKLSARVGDSAEKIEHDVDKLMHQVFGEGLLKVVADE